MPADYANPEFPGTSEDLMRREILEAAMLCGILGSFGGEKPLRPKVRVVENPQHTRNLFGPISEVAGKELEVMSRNYEGDCLCLFSGYKGENLVDVDHRDISK